MTQHKKVLGIVGSYRRDGYIDQAVTAVLASASEQGAHATKLYLADKQIAFCRNCRHCMQQPGKARGECTIEDDMSDILDQIDAADAYVIGAPTNFGNANALTRCFMERCAVYAYWPWGAPRPEYRNKPLTKRAVVIASSAAPGWMGKLFFDTRAALKAIAKVMGAKTIGSLWVGMANDEHPQLPERARQSASRLGRKLVA